MSATAVDLSLLEAMASALRVTLLRNQAVRSAGAGPAYSGFAAAARLEVAVAVTAVQGDASPELTLVVEGSADDGSTWVQAADPEVFATDGSRLITIDAPADWLRVRWEVAGGLRYGFVAEVAAVPASIEQPGGGGGDVVSVVAVNGWVKDLALPEGTTVLLLDARPKAWQANHEYSLTAIGGQQSQSAVATPVDGEGGEVWFRAVQPSGGPSGTVEPTWPTEGSATVDDANLRWSAQAYDVGGWVALKAAGDYNTGIIVANGRLWVALSGTASGSSLPDWSSAPLAADELTDGDIVWQNVGAVSTWQPSHAYLVEVGSDEGLYSPWVLPTAPAGFVFSSVVLTGIYQLSGSEEPDWDTTSGHYTIDGYIVWQASNDSSAWQLTLTGIEAPPSNRKVLVALAHGQSMVVKDERGSDDWTEGASAYGNGFECNISGDEPDDFDVQVAAAFHAVYLDSKWLPFGSSASPD